MSKYLRMAIALAVIVGVMAFVLRRDPNMPMIVGLVTFMTIALTAIFASPRAISFITGHASAVTGAGIFVVVASFGGSFAFLLSFSGPPPRNGDLATTLMVVGCMLGILLITLPRSAKAAAQRLAVAAQQKPAAVESTSKYPALREAMASMFFVLRHPGAFALITGPWIAVFVLVPLIAFQVTAYEEGTIKTILEPVRAKPDILTAVAMLYANIVCWIVAIPTAAVAWHRFVLENRLPRLGVALPDIRAIRYAYRLWIFVFVIGFLNRLLGTNSGDLAREIGPDAAAKAMEAVTWLVGFAAIWLASAFALVLPAIAFDDRQMNRMDAIGAARRLGHSYGLGLVASIAPFFIAAVALEAVLGSVFDNSFSVQQLLYFGPGILMFMAGASGATYLSRAWQAARATSGIQDAFS
jgi:hypothetical protein